MELQIKLTLFLILMQARELDLLLIYLDAVTLSRKHFR